MEEAIDVYRAVLGEHPGFVEARHNLGMALKSLGRLADASHEFEDLLSRHPNPAAFFALIDIEVGRQRPKQALAACRRATEAFPNDAGLWHRHALVAFRSQAFGEAVDAFRRSLALADNPKIWPQLALALKNQGRVEEAAEAFAAATRAGADGGTLIRDALLLPIIPRSVEDIEQWRARLSAKIETLLAAPPLLTDPLAEVGTTAFYLSYHDRDNRELQRRIAELYRRACPSLGFVASHCLAPQDRSGRRIRIGFVSSNFTEHTISGLNLGLLGALDRDLFEVSLFTLPAPDGPMRRAILAAADRVVLLADGLERARQQIAEARLDILYFTDIGMDAFTYFLGFARLAPLQVVTWGHPETTGLPAIDWFLSCAAMEPEDGASHYCEKLAALPGATVKFERPLRPPARSRSDYGLPEAGPLLLCPQSLFKFHPDFDSVLVRILRRVPDATLALLRIGDAGLGEALLSRLTARDPAVARQIHMLPYQKPADWLGLIELSDLMLDTVHYSGGKTSLEGFGLGKPIVTVPGRFMRGRHTFGFYRLMGLEDLAAASLDDYVEKAVRLASDVEHRAETSRRIAECSHRLFDDAESVGAIGQFLRAALDERMEATR